MNVGLGVALSLLTSVFKSGKSITVKLGAESFGATLTSWGFRFFSTLFFLLLLLLTPLSPVFFPTNTTYYIALTINITALSTATLLSAKVFEISDISIIAPLQAIIPIVTVIPAWVFLHETPTILAIIGILLVSVGTYILQVQSRTDSLTKPLKRLRDDKGTQYLGLMLLFVGIIPTVDKIGLQHSTPLLWVFSTHLGTSIVLFIVVTYRQPTGKQKLQPTGDGLQLLE